MPRTMGGSLDFYGVRSLWSCGIAKRKCNFFLFLSGLQRLVRTINCSILCTVSCTFLLIEKTSKSQM